MSGIKHIASPETVQVNSGMSPPDGVASWRQVFEREERAALAAFRSVAARVDVRPGVGGPNSKGQVIEAKVATEIVGAPQLGRATAMEGKVTPTGSPPARSSLNMLAIRPDPGAIRPLLLPHFFGTAASNTAANKKEAAVDQHAAVVSTGCSLPWPWRKLHYTVTADGAHVWLRDAGVAPGDPLLQSWLAELQHTLAANGTPLASFTLNGKACLVPTAVR